MTRATRTERGAKRAAIYERAAMGCEFGLPDFELSCRAIANAAYGESWSDRQWNAVVNPYVRLMSPDGQISWRSCPSWLKDSGLPREEQKDWRILALCFMAAMVEAGDA